MSGSDDEGMSFDSDENSEDELNDESVDESEDESEEESEDDIYESIDSEEFDPLNDLHHLAKFCTKNEIKMFLEKRHPNFANYTEFFKARVLSVKDSLGNTPLHVAVSSGNYETACYLTELGADVNLANFSCIKNRHGKIKYHIINGGQTPLHIAANLQNQYLINWLLSNGARLDCKDANENSCMHLIMQSGSGIRAYHDFVNDKLTLSYAQDINIVFEDHPHKDKLLQSGAQVIIINQNPSVLFSSPGASKSSVTEKTASRKASNPDRLDKREKKRAKNIASDSSTFKKTY